MATYDPSKRSVDPAVIEMIDVAEAAKIRTAFDRYKSQQPQCKFGTTGVCCRICLQGPCRILPNKPGQDKGICGADAYTIVARNLVRMIAGGCSAHSDHSREIAYTLLEMAEGHAPDYKVSDVDKLHRVAKKVGVAVEGRQPNEIAKDVALKALGDFGKIDHDPCTWLWAHVDDERKAKFKDTGVYPEAIDRAVVQLLHSTHIGVDADPINIIFTGVKAALADLTGSAMGTDITDILFGTPKPIVTESNMGVLDKDYINIAVHGHNPLLSQMVVFAAREMQAEAQAVGAKGIKLCGICCTGNEVLMREGVPTVTSFGAQELAVMTGVLDAMVVDVQCIMPGLKEVCACYNCKLITTSPISKIPSSVHIEFKADTAMEDAKEIIRIAIGQFKTRDEEKIHIPQYKKQVVGGFSLEALKDLFSKVRPDNPMAYLADAIRSGQIKGVVGIAGCNNAKITHEAHHIEIAKKLAEKDVFMVATGCGAAAYAKNGFLSGEGVEAYAGPGLKKFIKDLEEKCDINAPLPLVYHMGSCVDNSRLNDLWSELAAELGCTTSQVPFVASAPEAMSEKAVAIGTYVISNGIPCHVGTLPPVEGSRLIWETTTRIARDVFGGSFMFEPDVDKAIDAILKRLENRVWLLNARQTAAEKYNGAFPKTLFEAQ